MRLGAFRRLGTSVGRRFADDRLRRLFSFQSMYAGLAPYEALALYAVITYMDTVNGVVAADGGMHAVPRALAAAAVGRRRDVPLRHAGSSGSCSRDGAAGPVVGVELAGGERIATDVVVANPDLPVAYDTLLPGFGAPRAARRGRFSPSARRVARRRARRPAARRRRITTSTSAAAGTRRSTSCSTTARACPTRRCS